MVRAIAAALLLSLPAVGESGPGDRRPTDPQSIVSPSNRDARPVAIEDLFYTRAVGWPSWSPDSKQIAFVTNLTGRYNVWKVAAAGGWPIQLSQSEERQLATAWSPDGKWIAFASVGRTGTATKGALKLVSARGGRARTIIRYRVGNEPDTGNPSWGPAP
jgi:Tol biopolymer transport system component